MVLIGLSGFAQSGKDSTAAFLIKHHGFERVAFADPLRDIAYALNPVIGEANGPDRWQRLAALVDEYGWDEAKKVPEVRGTLQRLGMAVRDYLYADAWVDAAMNRARDLTRCVITDVRLPNEWHAVKDNGGYVVRVERPGVGAVNEHVSEHALAGYAFDATIHNDGHLDELGEKVERVMERLGIL